MITTALTIILFLLVLTLIVCIHELGHFCAAKYFGVKVEEFSIGMGPLVWKKKKGETQYSIRALPIGGYVKMLGEGESSEEKGSFSKAKAWKRLIIIYAGVVMNFVLVAVIFTAISIKTGGTFYGATLDPNYSYPFGDSHVLKQGVAGVEQDSPASKVGLQTLDVIDKVNGVDYKSPLDYSKFIGDNIGKPLQLEVVTYLSGDRKTVEVTPRDREKDKLSNKQTNTGVIPTAPYLVYVRADFNGIARPFAGILQTVNATHNYGATLGTIVGQAFKQKDITIVSDSLTSPIGTYAVTQKIISLNGFWGLLSLVALLSLAIGLMNAVPFPALDGWHGIFILIEMITKKKVNERIYNLVTTIGFVLLLALGAAIALKDVLNFNRLFS